MSYNLLLNNMTIYDTIFFSIKTVANYSSLQELKEKDYEEYSLWIDFVSSRFDSKIDDINYHTFAPLYPEFSKIVSAGYGGVENVNGEMKRELKLITKQPMDEVDIINKISDMFKYFQSRGDAFKPPYQHYICGFDLVNFELPYYIKKYLKYNNNEKKIPGYIENYITSQPWNSKIISVKDTFNFNSRTLFTNKDIIFKFLDVKNADSYIKDEEYSKFYWDNVGNMDSNIMKSLNLATLNTINTNIQYMMKFRG